MNINVSILPLRAVELSTAKQGNDLKVAYYSLWGSPYVFNNMITAAHCEGAHKKCKVKTIKKDTGCSFFYHALT